MICETETLVGPLTWELWEVGDFGGELIARNLTRDEAEEFARLLTIKHAGNGIVYVACHEGI